MSESVSFLLKTIGLGLLVGFSFGYLFKKVTKITILLGAIVVILVIMMGHNEILDIDWLSIKEKSHAFFERYFEQYEGSIRIFFRNIPFVTGLLFGGLIGLCKG